MWWIHSRRIAPAFETFDIFSIDTFPTKFSAFEAWWNWSFSGTTVFILFKQSFSLRNFAFFYHTIFLSSDKEEEKFDSTKHLAAVVTSIINDGGLWNEHISIRDF